jgi:blocked-early-in-transport protein 1
MTARDLLSLESQNDEELSGLHSKVAMLKKVKKNKAWLLLNNNRFICPIEQQLTAPPLI